MDKLLLLMSLTVFLKVLAQKTNKSPEVLWLKDSNFSRSLNESAIQFTIKWLYRQQNRLIPEFLNHSENIIGDLYSRFYDTKQLALDTQKSNDLNRMWFSVVERENNLVHSEVRFYRDCSRTDKFYRRSVNLTVYRILANEFHDQLVYVNSTLLPAFKSGWFSVDITDCYKHWMAFSEDNQGIQVVTEFAMNRRSRVRPELTGIVNFDAEPQKHAFLVSFFG